MQQLNLYSLASILFYIEEHPNPDYKLEQYSILPLIASSILLMARPHIKGKLVFDLGCGTGRFTIGAALLGAKEVWGIDVDEKALEIARENIKMVESEVAFKLAPIKLICMDVKKLKEKCDVVIQFPPFRDDIAFFKKAINVSERVYSVHKYEINTLKKLQLLSKKRGFKLKLCKNFLTGLRGEMRRKAFK